MSLYTFYIHSDNTHDAFGLAVYGVYNLTNVATLIGYSWTMVVVDTAWGTVWFGTLAAIYKLLMSVRLR